jgi:hypothetical protein
VIQLPHRAVTRFFVPLIDVLILLFCIFLLLPFVSKAEGESAKDDTDPTQLPSDTKLLQDRVQLAEAQVKALMAERANVADRMSVRVLEIEAETGKLFDYQREGPTPKRVEVANKADALLLIDRHKQKADGKPVYFLILGPRKLSGFPSEAQLREYRTWFQDVPHGFVNP